MLKEDQRGGFADFILVDLQVVLILEELQVPYVIESFRFNDVKLKPYTNICPNGRVPGMYHTNLDQSRIVEFFGMDMLSGTNSDRRSQH